MSETLEFHPRIVEEAIWRAISGRPEEAEFHRERTSTYSAGAPEDQDRAFAALHERWFRRLKLEEPVLQALREQPGWPAAVRRILVAPALTRKIEGAELFVAAHDARSVVVWVCPETLVDPGRVLLFLRRELMHIADMLDPAFGYEPSLPLRPAGPAHDRLLQERYRVLWSSSVDGRLVREGRLPGPIGTDARRERLRDFEAAFACLGARAGAGFARLFDGMRPAHAELVAMALDPERLSGAPERAHLQDSRCPLCAFPTTDFEPAPECLPEELLRTIVADFPGWKAGSGLCRQCADLYRARTLSSAAAARLPCHG